MAVFLLTLVVMLIVVAAMAVGVMMGRKPIAGSCGGVGAALGEPDYECEFCGGDPNKCETRNSTAAEGKDLSYDAGRRP